MSKSKSNENETPEKQSDGQFIVLSLGSNIGDRLTHLENALQKLNEQPDILVFDKSSVYETQPLEDPDQDLFLNIVVAARTKLSPRELLQTVKQLEKDLGRKKRREKGPREIDIDIIFYGDQVIDEPDLKIPHERFHERKFVLVPLSHMIPGFISPIHDKTIANLLKECPDGSLIQLYEHII